MSRKWQPGIISSSREKKSGYVRWHISSGGRTYTLGFEHRILVEWNIGRPLSADETVHHKNGIKDDNRLENLEVVAGYHPPGSTVCPHCGGAL